MFKHVRLPSLRTLIRRELRPNEQQKPVHTEEGLVGYTFTLWNESLAYITNLYDSATRNRRRDIFGKGISYYT